MMPIKKVLLDSYRLLWLELDPPRIPAALLEMLGDPGIERYLSAASAWTDNRHARRTHRSISGEHDLGMSFASEKARRGISA